MYLGEGPGTVPVVEFRPVSATATVRGTSHLVRGAPLAVAVIMAVWPLFFLARKKRAYRRQ
jgi:hypothetical protein